MMLIYNLVLSKPFLLSKDYLVAMTTVTESYVEKGKKSSKNLLNIRLENRTVKGLQFGFDLQGCKHKHAHSQPHR